MSKKKRRLWLNIQVQLPQKGRMPRLKTVIKTLIKSIDNGTYELPSGWNVTLLWRNKELAPMRSGKWEEEMQASSESSQGFDLAVRSYLIGKLNA